MGWTNTENGWVMDQRRDGRDQTEMHIGVVDPELSVACTAGSPAAHIFCDEVRGTQGGAAWAAALGAC